MLGFRRSATTLYDISKSLLRNVSFHGLRVQGIRVGNAEVPNHKPLKTGIQEVYGIRRRKSHHVLCALGITNKLARDLTGKELIDLREEVGQHQHGDELFHGLRVQGIRVGNTEVPNHKPLKIGIQEVYGIGRRKSHQVLCALGITNKLARDLTGKELIDLREEVGQHQHGDELRRRVGSEIQRLIEVDYYRGVDIDIGFLVEDKEPKLMLALKRERELPLPERRKLLPSRKPKTSLFLFTNLTFWDEIDQISKLSCPVLLSFSHNCHCRGS